MKAKVTVQMKTGLVLEGGAMRGMFTAGVIDVLMENSIKFDGIIGVSAGAAFGCNYKSNQIGRVIRYNTKYIKDKRYCGLRVLLREGNLYSTEFCYGVVPLELDVFDFDTYEKTEVEFYVVCTDIETGEAVYHKYEGKRDHGFDWIRASASMPLVSKIVEIEGKKLLDGGMADSIPVREFEKMGFLKNVVVLTQPEDYVKSKNPLIPLMKLKYRKYPKLVETMARRHRLYNETLGYIKEKEKRGELLVIRPESALPLSKTEKDPEKLRAVYNLGRSVAEKRLKEIREYLT